MNAPASFSFATATRIVFGCGKSHDLPSLAAQYGSRALLVTGSHPGRHHALLARLESELRVAICTCSAEPTTDDARRAVQQARSHQADLVIAVGGGSALDLGKATAALATNPGDPLDYLEVVGSGKPLLDDPLPFVAVPTTSGTGAEVTKNAVLDAREQGVKVSLRSDLMLPNLALVDPELTLGVPAQVTANTGFDALAQVIEPFLSCQANPMTDALCREGIRRGAGSLLTAFREPDNLVARSDMALTSLFGGLALANAKLGAVHGFAGPLGGMFHAPHGALCAALLPHVLRTNLQVLRGLAAGEDVQEYLHRFDELGPLLCGDGTARAEDAILWCERTAEQLGIQGLANHGVRSDDFERIIAAAGRSSSMKGNPIRLDGEQLTATLRAAL